VTEENKIRIESFQLFFNDTASYFAVVPSNEPEEMAWLTTKNAYYQNLKANNQLMMLAVLVRVCMSKIACPNAPGKSPTANATFVVTNVEKRFTRKTTARASMLGIHQCSRLL
jgi:hypothetical protein